MSECDGYDIDLSQRIASEEVVGVRLYGRNPKLI